MQSTPGTKTPESLTFSVVIPTFDRPEYLRGSLDSLVEQRFSKDRFEVIVVDDGGSIPAQTVVAEYDQRICVTVCRQERAGPAAARNAGAVRARAKYIAFMDDDCRADPEWLRELDTAFATGISRSLLGGCIVNGAPENVFADVGELILGVILDYYRPEPGGIYFFRAANLAVSAAELRCGGGFDVGFRTAEDRELCDRWLHGGGSLVHVPSARVVHLNRLSFRGFCRQHFFYGKGAFHFHRLRRARGSGQFHAKFSLFYVRVFRAAFIPTQSSVSAKLLLLLVWQAVNVAGFLSEMLAHFRPRKDRESR
jgi:glycosyltransferase involved in cell wall biosynthesis